MVDQEINSNLKSIESKHRSFVIFVNKTERIIDVYWVNFHAAFIHYITLKPEEQGMVNTYKSHPWIFKDAHSGESLHVNNRCVFWPIPWYLTNIDLNEMRIKRQIVNIHLPLRTLREKALFKVLEFIKNESDIETLEIPKILTRDLNILYNQLNKIKRS